RPNTQFNTIAYLSNGADSVYHSMQASLRKRFSAGFQFNTSFTWSKAIDDQSSDPVGTGSTPSAGGGGVVDATNLRGNRARANWDLKFVSVTNWIYELPFGKGRKWGANSSALLNSIVGGWSIQGFNALMSGTPFSVSSGVPSAFNGANSRAILAPGVTDLP